ncbi:hypothetical protein PR002_g12057 [Phytophthora rubi]|uniref:Uncharacterized protein n=1 Tax=Phytophthora rubi TaxID=129364 RepID=A0A6A3LV59_9STRA|nr:hypothetical protein PR002_g12057 [Phytophthora rubi]
MPGRSPKIAWVTQFLRAPPERSLTKLTYQDKSNCKRDTTATGCKQRALKGRASAGAAAICCFQGAQGIARASNEALIRYTRMANDRDAAPSQAGRDAAMAGGPDAAPSQAGVAAGTPPRTAAERAAHARTVKAEKQAHPHSIWHAWPRQSQETPQ